MENYIIACLKYKLKIGKLHNGRKEKSILNLSSLVLALLIFNLLLFFLNMQTHKPKRRVFVRLKCRFCLMTKPFDFESN